MARRVGGWGGVRGRSLCLFAIATVRPPGGCGWRGRGVAEVDGGTSSSGQSWRVIAKVDNVVGHRAGSVDPGTAIGRSRAAAIESRASVDRNRAAERSTAVVVGSRAASAKRQESRADSELVGSVGAIAG